MLRRCADHAGDGLTFERAHIAEWAASEPVDLVFSNAALHWIDDHHRLFARLTGALSPGSQLAVQMPASHDYPSHLVAERLGAEEPFALPTGATSDVRPPWPSSVTGTCSIASATGPSTCGCRVYLHLLAEAGAAVDWGADRVY
jgi:trans-aconitate 2-methyltransferase